MSRWLAFGLTVFFVIAAACGGNGGDVVATNTVQPLPAIESPTAVPSAEVVPSPTGIVLPQPGVTPVAPSTTPRPTATSVSTSRPTPTATPANTPQPTSTAIPTSTPIPQISEPHVDLETLIIPVCRTDPYTGGSAGFGTIPRAPANGSSPPPIGPVLPSDSDIQLVRAMAPVALWVDHFTGAADMAWNDALSEQDFALALAEESRRLWLACGAVAAVASGLDPGSQFVISVNSSFASWRQWLADRLEVLRSAPELIRNDDDVRASTSKVLLDLTATLDDLAADAGMESGATPTQFTVPNPLLEVSIDVSGGWLLIRNRIDVVLVAPPGLQAEGVRGLGVPGWNFGTALRVRRLRHEAPWTLADTSGLMDSLLVKFGGRVSDGDTEVDGHGSIVRVYEAPDDGWVTIAAATVRDLHSYLFELGCPVAERDSCEELLQSLLAGVHFTDP